MEVDPTIVNVLRDGTARFNAFKKNLEHYERIAVYLKLAARDDIRRGVQAGRFHRQAGYQLDHIFELQYFAMAFTFAVAEYESTADGQGFVPDVDDIRYAVSIVNGTSNVKAISEAKHALKTGYFKLGACNAALREDGSLIQYLADGATAFKQIVDHYMEPENLAKERNPDFRRRLLKTLMETPWYMSNWGDFLGEVTFATNYTLDNVIHNFAAFEDDNVFHNGA